MTISYEQAMQELKEAEALLEEKKRAAKEAGILFEEYKNKILLGMVPMINHLRKSIFQAEPVDGLDYHYIDGKYFFVIDKPSLITVSPSFANTLFALTRNCENISLQKDYWILFKIADASINSRFENDYDYSTVFFLETNNLEAVKDLCSKYGF